jgi:predicted nucleic acid-binding protein
MKIVVDTNIIFSILLNSNGTIGNILFNSDKIFEFYSCSYMRFEIKKHWPKLKKISMLNDKELSCSYDLLLSKITFIDEKIIPVELWIAAEKITQHIDIDDTDFIAISNTKYKFNIV